MSENQYFDAGVVGAGIVGLAHAYHLAKRGMKVAVFERNSRAEGASIRDSGMILPIAQPPGRARKLALRSRDLLCEVLKETGIKYEECGSLHLAYRQDEAQVLDEFANSLASAGIETELLTPAQVASKSNAAQQKGLMAGLWSRSEACFDPREAIPKLTDRLRREHGVQFFFNCAVNSYHRPVLAAGGRCWKAGSLFVCCGDAYESLFPRLFEGVVFLRSKRQLMRTTPYAETWRLGPMLASGLTLRQSESFSPCLSMESLKARIASESPLFDRYGIHAIVSRNGSGELVIGESCERDAEIDPFDKVEIDRLILDYLFAFLDVPSLRIASRWHIVQSKHPRDAFSVVDAAPGATVVANLGEAGMTLAFGLAEEIVRERAL